ncbi:MbnP family protein [Pedobacter rhizosphaerae]|nr:MbnP family protein [Pedobacter rhizosphaerae]
MNAKIKSILLILTIGLLLGFTSKTDDTGNLTISFNHFFKGQKIDFTSEFVNSHDEKIKFSTLNYFISNIKLTKKDGTSYSIPQDSSYFLVKESEIQSKQLHLKNIPKGEYSGITFTVGVDSVRNTMDIARRTGALDVGGTAKGMYWIWNSGYIFFKMEGTSPSAPDQQKNKFAYHVGGFGGYNTKTINSIRTKEFETNGLMVSRDKNPVVAINVDLAGMFDAHTPIKIAERSTVMWGDISTKIADNYISCFKFFNLSYK